MKMLKKNQITILFTCVGRRVELLEAFRSAAFDLGIDLLIIGTDTSAAVPTFPIVIMLSLFAESIMRNTFQHSNKLFKKTMLI
jgi:hypothetical protein